VKSEQALEIKAREIRGGTLYLESFTISRDPVAIDGSLNQSINDSKLTNVVSELDWVPAWNGRADDDRLVVVLEPG